MKASNFPPQPERTLSLVDSLALASRIVSLTDERDRLKEELEKANKEIAYLRALANACGEAADFYRKLCADVTGIK